MYKQQKPLTVSSALLASLVTVLVLIAAATANAQNEDEATSEQEETRAASNSIMQAGRMENRIDAQSKVAEIREELASKRAALASSTVERKAALTEQSQERISARVEKMIELLTTAIYKLRDFSQRIQDHASTLSDSGVDIGKTTTLLTAVDAALEEAVVALEDIDVNLEFALTSERPSDDWQDVKSQILLVRDQIREAHSLLREAMTELKEATTEGRQDNGIDDEA